MTAIGAFGDRLSLAMVLHNHDCRRAAMAIGVSAATVSRVERGMPFRIDTLPKFVTYMDLTPQTLWDILIDGAKDA